jgi:hypothetical protein
MSKKIKRLKTKTYTPIDNGGYPFIVNVNKEIEVINKEKKVFRSSYEKIFVGKNGSSILVKKPNEYVFIGAKIKSFKALDEIKTFHSPLDNASVVYPYAVGNKYTYLMIEDKYIPNDVLEKGDPYKQYYDFAKTYNIKKYAVNMKSKVLFTPSYS